MVKALMVQLLRLSKIAGTTPPHFRADTKGSQGTEILFGSEQDIRKALVKAGVAAIDLDLLFRLAETDGNRKR
jgi:hypothetical protein